jgi:hypothetical protein
MRIHCLRNMFTKPFTSNCRLFLLITNLLLSNALLPFSVSRPLPRNECCFRAVRKQRLFRWVYSSWFEQMCHTCDVFFLDCLLRFGIISETTRLQSLRRGNSFQAFTDIRCWNEVLSSVTMKINVFLDVAPTVFVNPTFRRNVLPPPDYTEPHLRR